MHLQLVGLTFIQPVTEAIVDHALLTCRHHSDCLLPNVCTVVDVVLKDKYLIWKEEIIAEIKQGVGLGVLKFESARLLFPCCAYLIEQRWSQNHLWLIPLQHDLYLGTDQTLELCRAHPVLPVFVNLTSELL